MFSQNFQDNFPQEAWAGGPGSYSGGQRVQPSAKHATSPEKVHHPRIKHDGASVTLTDPTRLPLVQKSSSVPVTKAQGQRPSEASAPRQPGPSELTSCGPQPKPRAEVFGKPDPTPRVRPGRPSGWKRDDTQRATGQRSEAHDHYLLPRASRQEQQR